MKKQILIGEDSFEKIIEGDYYYIDKTLFIKEFFEHRGAVTLITRPRRFGKTMNMSMLKHFFDINADSRAMFDGLKIMEHEGIVSKHMNKHPVFFLTLKNVEQATYAGSIRKIKFFVSEIFRQNLYLCESARLDEFQKKKFYRYCSEEAVEEELEMALYFLTECLHTYHKKRVVVLLDEYDAPINNALMDGYYHKMVKFMRGFMGSVFKTNDHLEFGVLTGVFRISKESLVSSFNNPKICGIMDVTFSTCFGFTEEEVKEACKIYGLDDKYDEVKQWYDGYRFGGQDMYNPWSIISFLDFAELDDYWIKTGSVQIFREMFYKGNSKLKNELAALLAGSSVKMHMVDITYPIEYVSSDAFWTILLNAGYLKPCNGARKGQFAAELVNDEVRNILSLYAKTWFNDQQPSISEIIVKFVQGILTGDSEGVSSILNRELLNDPSCFDFKEENSYHMFIYGILLAVSDQYTVLSNPESGKGRSDCLIKPIDKERYAVAIEFKYSKEDSCDLKALAQSGLGQIEEKSYIHHLKREGYDRLLKYGIAFHKKTCEVAMKVES